ncbi:MAG: polyprenyl diphosphate synthase [Pseudomonadota bacterium]
MKISIPAEKIPRHIAIILDGNGRWAEQRGKSRYSGHRAGANRVHDLVETCVNLPVEALTLFAFSSENWQRPRLEVKLLLDLFLLMLKREARRMHAHDVRLRVIGDISQFPRRLQHSIAEVEQLTGNNRSLTLQIAANYGGRWDITQAVRQLAHKVTTGTLTADDITPETISQHLTFPDLAEPDLFIRTGGELRISNFLLWQCAYTELYFTDTLWPDFDLTAFEQALASFARRQRRFGRTGQQLKT